MGKGKLAKFADMARMEHVFEFPYDYATANECPLRGCWHDEVFHNQNPIVLELGCGRGEYTVGLARTNPDVNYIGVDIKGARMWTGATEAEREGLKNVAFLRTNIEIIDHFFAPGEVSEVWLTFSDPQMKKVTKRLTSTWFINRYRNILTPEGIVHLKTDSNFLYTYTEEMLKANDVTPLTATRNLYGASEDDNLLTAARSIQTYYESMWRERGIDIKYMAFGIDAFPSTLVEPDVEIELDEYRSYNRSKRSGKDTAK